MGVHPLETTEKENVPESNFTERGLLAPIPECVDYSNPSYSVDDNTDEVRRRLNNVECDAEIESTAIVFALLLILSLVVIFLFRRFSKSANKQELENQDRPSLDLE